MSIITEAMGFIAQLPDTHLTAVVILGAFGLAAYAISVVGRHSGNGK